VNDVVQSIQQGLGMPAWAVMAAASVISAMCCLVLPRLPWFRDLSVEAPPDNPCHASGRKSKVGGFSLVFAGLLLSGLAMGSASPWRALPIYLGGLFLIGLLDDLHPLTPGWKIVLQIPMALFVVLSIPRAGFVHMGLPWVVLQVGWIVVMTNAYNIVDVADGLLAGLALPALALIGVVNFQYGLHDVALLSLAFSGALLGFLLFNATPGRVMLGDSGSLPIGGLISFLVLLEPTGASAVGSLLWVVPLAGVVIVEVLWVSVRRIRRGIPPWRGSPHHLVYWIVDRGVPLRWAVVGLSLVQTLLLLPFAAAFSLWWWIVPTALGLLILSLGSRRRLGAAG
jgi:UDP-GlcNAc:undecaprenyl-phosphate GlcNAc-1-phosphate transferase